MGRLDQARDIVKRLRTITPAVIPPDIMYLRDDQHRELYLSGLRGRRGDLMGLSSGCFASLSGHSCSVRRTAR